MATTAGVRTPAPVPSPAVALRDLAALIGRWYRDRRDRRELAGLDDSLLGDIGLSRADVEREYLKPFWRPIDRDVLQTARRRQPRPRA